jgi:hypothetical protein
MHVIFDSKIGKKKKSTVQHDMVAVLHLNMQKYNFCAIYKLFGKTYKCEVLLYAKKINRHWF